jgi:hypothetical protein
MTLSQAGSSIGPPPSGAAGHFCQAFCCQVLEKTSGSFSNQIEVVKTRWGEGLWGKDSLPKVIKRGKSPN